MILIYLNTEEEEKVSDCLSRSSYSPGSEKRVKEHHKKLSTKRASNRGIQTLESSHDLDADVRINSSGVTEAVKVPSPQNKKRSRSGSKVVKQSSLDSYVHTASSEKSASPLTSEPEAGAKQRPRQPNRFQMPSSLSSMKTGASRIPQSTSEIKTSSDSSDCDGRHLPKLACSPKSSELKIPKVAYKKNHVDVPGSSNRFNTPSNNAEDDSVFEDYFTSANDAPKRKLLVAHSTSEAERLPSFDLEPLVKTRRKSQSQDNCSRNRKSKTFNDRAIMEASGPPEEEFSAECMGAALPGPKESKFEEPEPEPAAKKPRRKSKQNSISLSESKDEKSISELTYSCL